MELNVLLLILIPLITAFLIPLIDIIYIKVRKLLVISSAAGELIVAILLLTNNYQAVIRGDFLIKYLLGGWASSLGITIVMDGLSLFFSLLICLSMFLIILYSIGFIGHHEGKYYVLLFLVSGAMQGAILTGDLFNLYVFIELITVTSAALVAFKRNREGAEAAFKYLFYGVVGGLFFLIAVFLIYFSLGTLNMESIAAHVGKINPNLMMAIIVFFLTSLFIKSGIFPFHFWLPKAHSACPGPISALLSGVLLKVFIYIFLRLFWPVFGFALLSNVGLHNFIIYLGLFSSTLGHLLAFKEDDLKRLLAFSTIGHIGMIAAALALNTVSGLAGGLLHVFSHLLMKTTLFIIAGYLLQYADSHHIADFNGIAYKNQGIFIAFIIAAMGMVGVPPLPGFFSKYYILKGFIESGYYFAAFLIIILSVISLFYYLRYIFRGYNLLDYERGIKPRKLSLVLSVFYREKIVTGVAYIFTIIMLVSGIFYWLFTQPVIAIVQNLLRRA
ncbi:proton-conducting transporter membrane subunit [Halocella sp. SP3-1]|uniref:complex I subunit 5 family protein n=1 Tax=Halocella sp. SP3-1 TaxID=2382161 RepID=UPI000F760BA7|nr:proton-conducting transporter membrane subunit [Halocella sp. SP3-1]AZO96037.1 Na+/H+ antiporter subunit D [Halocella sp. SP3-1]